MNTTDWQVALDVQEDSYSHLKLLKDETDYKMRWKLWSQFHDFFLMSGREERIFQDYFEPASVLFLEEPNDRVRSFALDLLADIYGKQTIFYLWRE